MRKPKAAFTQAVIGTNTAEPDAQSKEAAAVTADGKLKIVRDLI